MGVDVLRQAADAIRSARRVVATTGAGISAESGVPTFRGPDGLWRNFRPTDLATPEAFARDPGLVWEWYRWRRERIREARPNPGHAVLARFEQAWPAFQLITQNVDGLHRLAGSRRLLELHGNIWRAKCRAGCGYVVDERDESPRPVPHADPRAVPVCRCGAALRPDVVWFGEPLDPTVVDQALQAARSCDVLLVVGTSAVVYPAASLPGLARREGACIIEINVEDTPLTPEADLVLRGPSGEILPALESLL